ncbi:MAG: flagellar protein FlaG [Clostridium sp.]|nr:flagellar protein FlaG [Clostridium sp.]MDY4875388.1 flagellar protein FlaG [Eubacterium sp.]
MDMESISSVNSNYSSTESVKVKSAPVESAHIAAQSVSEASSAVVRTVSESGEATNQNRGGKEHNPSEATIDDAVKSANRRMEHTRCEYSYHKETNRVSIKVINEDTDEVIREIPPEKSLDMLQKMWEMAGILVDEKR